MKLSELDLTSFDAVPSSSLRAVVPMAAPAAALMARRLRLLTADGQAATRLEQEAVLGTDDRVEANFLDRAMLVRPCVGRIRVTGEGHRGWATGFLVAPGLVLTNHHVFPSAQAIGASRIAFDFWFDVAGGRPQEPDDYAFRPDLFFVADKSLDYALVQVEAMSINGHAITARRHLRLIRDSGKARSGEFVTIMQYPRGEPMQIALRENEVVRAEEQESFIHYQADTAHGSSGAPVFNDQFQVVALHASGQIRRDAQGHFVLAKGGSTTTLDGLDESDVLWETNVGYRVSRISDHLLKQTRALWPDRASQIEAAMEGGDVMSEAVAIPGSVAPKAVTISAPNLQEESMTAPDRTTRADVAVSAPNGTCLTIPLQIRLTLEHVSTTPDPARTIPAETVGGTVERLETEAYELRMPIIYDSIDERPGFDAGFLGSTVPMPKITPEGQGKLAPLVDGTGTELKYRHFSIWMHAERRLAMLTAANVDWRSRKKVVDGHLTTRNALAGWGEKDNFAELWADEERIDPRHQLPDDFFTSDRGAFDKGHLVRRDDVCWGETLEEIQMANGDTYHVTNCSPQTKAFNQGQHGEENWGDLETAIQTITKQAAERCCIFAGPVLRATDEWFRGQDTSGPVRVRIPTRYWKIVVVQGLAGFEAYGFVLEQDVSALTEKEFYVAEQWKAKWKRISHIQSLLRGWIDLSELASVDQRT